MVLFSGFVGNKHKLIHLLVVDDATIIRESLIDLIEEEDDFMIIGEAENGLDAYEKTKIEEPDVILMDINMPLMDGIEATKMIKNDYPDIKIIGLSVNDDPFSKKSMMEAGANAYFTKDSEMDELFDVIRNSFHY